MSDYKPGTLAVITVRGREHTAVRDSNDAWLIGDVDDLRIINDLDDLVTTVHVLPVIDVRKKLELSIMRDALIAQGLTSVTNEQIAGAIVAISPKPPEPLGFAAVVLDLDGRRWLRDDMEDEEGPWFYSPPERGAEWLRSQYADLLVVAILQSGVVA